MASPSILLQKNDCIPTLYDHDYASTTILGQKNDCNASLHDHDYALTSILDQKHDYIPSLDGHDYAKILHIEDVSKKPTSIQMNKMLKRQTSS